MAIHVNVDYLGELRCRATHGPSASTLVTDAPVDNQGRGEMFSPTDLVGAALGGCMLTIMGQVAKRHAIDLAGARAEVVKHMVADPARRIGRLEVTIHVPAPTTPDQRAMLERAAKTCPVHHSLDPRIEIPLTFVWG